MGKWESGKMGKWGSGEMGKWGNGKVGKWENDIRWFCLKQKKEHRCTPLSNLIDQTFYVESNQERYNLLAYLIDETNVLESLFWWAELSHITE